MADQSATALKAQPREAGGSRSARRLRREGQVPGVVYGGGEDPVSFAVNARELRHALADTGAVMDLQLEGGSGIPVVLKELIRHPVSGAAVHLDLLRVRLDQAIHAPVVIELTGAEDAPGLREGGVLEQPLREVVVEALPNNIPDTLTYDVSSMNVNDTVTLEVLKAPSGVTIITDPESVLATITPPRLQVEEETDIETETGVVGQGEGGADAEGEAGEGESPAGEGEASSSGGDSEASE
jgi:large subunit ribosomal protein L25